MLGRSVQAQHLCIPYASSDHQITIVTILLALVQFTRKNCHKKYTPTDIGVMLMKYYLDHWFVDAYPTNRKLLAIKA
jgi:hypothetical protein